MPSSSILASRARVLATVAILALPAAGCLKRNPADMTGSIEVGVPTADASRRNVEAWAVRFQANPADAAAALRYAAALRANDQRAQAVAVLQAPIPPPRSLSRLGLPLRGGSAQIV